MCCAVDGEGGPLGVVTLIFYHSYYIAGDVVDFQIAKDRRDGLLHATSISLCEESFIVSKEKRDKGMTLCHFFILDSPKCTSNTIV